MGADNSKPTFPSEQQWSQWKQDTSKDLDAKVATVLKERNDAITKETQEVLGRFNDYLKECHDRSGLKKFLFDADECSEARTKMFEEVAGLLLKANAANVAVSKLNELNPLK